MATTPILRTILVPLDGSPLAECALPAAADLARAAGARLVLVRAVPLLTRAGDATAGMDVFAHQRAAGEEAGAYLATVAAQLTEEGATVATAVALSDAAEGILEEAGRCAADLIVMATHGQGGLGRWLYGSVAERLLPRVTIPVLLVRAWASAPPALAAGARLLVLLDGSTQAEAALPAAAALARALQGTLVLLRVVLVGESEEELGWYLRAVAARYHDLPVEWEARADPQGATLPAAIPGVIFAAGRDHRAALVALGTRGRTGFGRLFLGSVADAVLRGGELPLLLIGPRAVAGGEPADAPGPLLRAATVGEVSRLVTVAPLVARPADTLRDLAVAVCQHPGARVAAVAGEDGRLAGIIPLRALIEAILVLDVAPDDPPAAALGHARALAHLARLQGRTARDLMRPPIAARPEDTADEAFAIMRQAGLAGLPVVDAAGRVIGEIDGVELLLAWLRAQEEGAAAGG